MCGLSPVEAKFICFEINNEGWASPSLRAARNVQAPHRLYDGKRVRGGVAQASLLKRCR